MARSLSDIEPWPDYLSTAWGGLRDLIVTAAGGRTLPAAEGFARWAELTLRTTSRARVAELADALA